MSKYKWHGEPVKTRFGFYKIDENKAKPLYWYNFECAHDVFYNPIISQRAYVPCIEVSTSDGQVFYIANHFGIGVHKLLAGGWPSHSHFSLSGGIFEENWNDVFYQFDLDGYEKHEAKRRKWQQKEFPDEFAKSERLMKMARS